MKKQAFFAFIISLVITACNQNKPAADRIPVVGDSVDASAIANDTLQQKSIEQSYEYAHTVVVNPKLVYDIRAYGGPASHGQYCILRRGVNNVSDTVVMARRFGTIVNAFTADLNHNGKEEIYLVMKKAGNLAFEPCYVAGYEFDGKGISTPILFGDSTKTNSINGPWVTHINKILPDTIFAVGNLLIKTYPDYINDTDVRAAYKLIGNKCILYTNP